MTTQIGVRSSATYGFAAMLLIALTGVSQLRAAETPPAVGDVAKDFELTALDGKPVKLSTMAAKGPVVLVVLRGYPGYQCPLCTKQFAAYMGKAGDFKAAGIPVLFVYPGPADDLKAHAQEFVQNKTVSDNFHVLLDPDFTFTNSYGLRWDAPKETSHPSTFVIDPDLKITYAKIGKGHGDRSDPAAVLKEAEKK